jgi:hypothetical protein
MIEVFAVLCIMVGSALVGGALVALVAQAGRNELEARHLAMLHRAWWSTDCQVALGMEFEEWVAHLERAVDAERRAS